MEGAKKPQRGSAVKMRRVGGLLGLGTGGDVDLRAGAASLPLHAHPPLCVAVGSGPGPRWWGLPGEDVGKRTNLLVAISSPPCMKLCDYLSFPGHWVLVVGKGRKESPARGGVVLVMWVLSSRSARCGCRRGKLCNTQKGCRHKMPMKMRQSSDDHFPPQRQG